jgi:hypothetical protein
MKSEDYLETIKTWYLESAPSVLLYPPCEKPLTHVEGVTGFVLFRKDQIQVQLFLVEPNTEIPDHTHPNVDSYEVYLAGDLAFRLNGEMVLPEQIRDMRNEDGVSQSLYASVRVLPNAPHGATVGPRGGAFLSIQHWLNGVPPTSVGDDWDGKTMGPVHDSFLV